MSKRSIFEDVGGAKTSATAAVPVRGREARGAIALWLLGLALLTAVMVLIGGLTRLTDSGLSITVWDPVMGALPPLSGADWQAAFDPLLTPGLHPSSHPGSDADKILFRHTHL